MSNTCCGHNIANFLICGLIKSPMAPWLGAWFHPAALHKIKVAGYGHLFFSTPNCLDWAEDERLVLLKLGHARLSGGPVTARELLDSAVIDSVRVDAQRIHGHASLICLDKRQPRLCAYNTLISSHECYYRETEGALLISNNLGRLVRLQEGREMNRQSVPLHFIFRAVPGRTTYFRDIHRLLPGETLIRQDDSQRISRSYTLRELAGDEYNRHPVTPVTVDACFEEIRQSVGWYLEAANNDSSRWTTLLSGGTDSSILQLAINQLQPPSAPRTSHTYAPQAASFAPEIEYAKSASRLFGTTHTFVPVLAAEYPELLIAAIRTLGQPPHHESTACEWSLFTHLATHAPLVKYLFSAHGADTLHGSGAYELLGDAAMYRHWPIPAISVFGWMIFFISPSKARTARHAGRLLNSLRHPESPTHPLNACGAFTNWGMMRRCFAPREIRDALACRRDLEVEQLDSENMTEKAHVTRLLADVLNTASLDNQLALAHGQQINLPFLDDALIRNSLTFNTERFFSAGRTKPVLKQILESNTTSGATRSLKRGGGFRNDLFAWMRDGVLCDMVHDIQRPAFMTRTDFARSIESPDWFTWNLLTLDLFEKHVVGCVRDESTQSPGSF